MLNHAPAKIYIMLAFSQSIAGFEGVNVFLQFTSDISF